MPRNDCNYVSNGQFLQPTAVVSKCSRPVQSLAAVDLFVALGGSLLAAEQHFRIGAGHPVCIYGSGRTRKLTCIASTLEPTLATQMVEIIAHVAATPTRPASGSNRHGKMPACSHIKAGYFGK